MNKLSLGFMLLALALLRVAHAQEPPASPAPSPAASAPAKKAATVQAATKAPAKSAMRADRLDLETTLVTGNRELPEVLYIVPWKKADLGELPAQPFNTLLDEVLQPVDREVFKREVKYFQAVSSGTGTGADGAKSGSTPPPVSQQ